MLSFEIVFYQSIYAWDVQTAGLWDRDTEMTLYTRNRWDLAKFSVDFRTGKADIAQINHFLSALIVGLPSDKMVNFAKKDYSSGKGEANPFPKGASFGILDNKWEIDAGPVEEKLRTDPCILLEEEKVIWDCVMGLAMLGPFHVTSVTFFPK